jgi:hypothetical protein
LVAVDLSFDGLDRDAGAVEALSGQFDVIDQALGDGVLLVKLG